MNERLSIQDLINLLAEKHGMGKKEADWFVKEFFLLIEQGLENDKCVKIKGLGTFNLFDVDSPEGVEVNADEHFQIQGHTNVSFTPDTALRDLINKPFGHFETVPLNANTILEDTPMDNSEEDTDECVEMTEEFNTLVEDSPIAVEEPVAGAAEEPPAVEQKLSVEEIIAQEVKWSNHRHQPTTTVKDQKRSSKVVPDKSENQKSPVLFLVVTIFTVLVLCGGALLYMYNPDILSLFEKQEIVKEEDSQHIMREETSLVDTLKKDTVAEVVPEAKQEVLAQPVREVPESVKIQPKVEPIKKEAAKTESKTVPKTGIPVKPDSVNYEIKGTKTTYTVKEGETLTRVSLQFYGTKNLWPYIVKHNSGVIKNPNSVPYGTVLKIPELVKK